MKQNTGNEGAPRPHIDDLRVVHGHAFLAPAIATVALGRHDRDELDAFDWLYLPAGRGE